MEKLLQENVNVNFIKDVSACTVPNMLNIVKVETPPIIKGSNSSSLGSH